MLSHAGKCAAAEVGQCRYVLVGIAAPQMLRCYRQALSLSLIHGAAPHEPPIDRKPEHRDASAPAPDPSLAKSVDCSRGETTIIIIIIIINLCRNS